MAIYPEYFYHKTLLNCTKIFGTLFNDITIKRYNKSGKVKKNMKVKLTYSPKDKLLERVLKDPSLTKKTAINLPIIGFEMTGMNYDSTRRNNPLNRRYVNGSDGNTQKSMYEPIPYNIQWNVSILVDKQEDGLQIIEQIIPFFAPKISIPSKLIFSDMSEIDDLIITMTDISPEMSYEGSVQDRELMQWNLNFEMKMSFFHPVIDQTSIIKKIITNLTISDDPQSKSGGDKVQIQTQPGLTDEGKPTTDINDSIPTSDIEADDDYGFIEDFLDIKG